MTELAAAAVIHRATQLGVRVAVAESLTGGQLCSSLVDVPGASLVVSGGVVAYDTALKASLLGVDADALARTGPVDERVAREMAAGVRRACAVPDASGALLPADIGLATTGVAGPDPDPQTGQAAGTVWLGVSSALGERALRVYATGTRSEIRVAAVSAALQAFAEELSRLAQLRNGNLESS